MADTGRRGRRKRRQTKDRVLQARIPEHLDEELRGRAEQLGLSVSTIVRNTLMHTFDLVEGVVADTAQVVRVAQGREQPAPPEPPPDGAGGGVDTVVGWQQLILNKNGLCEKCNAVLPMGTDAAIGVPVQARPVLLCLDCLAALSSAAREPVEEPAPQATKARKPSRAARRSGKPEY